MNIQTKGKFHISINKELDEARKELSEVMSDAYAASTMEEFQGKAKQKQYKYLSVRITGKALMVYQKSNSRLLIRVN